LGSPELSLPPPNQPPLEPLVFSSTSQDADHVMHDPFGQPFNGQSQELDWSDDDHYYTRLNRIQVLLRDLHTELDTARNEQSIALILEDEDVEEQLIKLAAILPSFTSNSMVTPVMKGLSNLQEMMGKLTERITKMESPHSLTPSADKALSGSIHASPSYASTLAPAPSPRHHTSPPQPSLKPKAPQTSAQNPKLPSNPNSPYHPSRLVALFPPGGIPVNMRPDPSRIVAEINNALASNPSSNNLKVVAANFNAQGNLIMSTRSDQTASDLIKFNDLLTPVLAQLGNNVDVQLREDKKWYKIQIDAVNTSTISISNTCIPLSAEAVHSELLSCNPQYAQLQDTLVSKPKWMRSVEELRNTSKSSLVFATTDESAARQILKLKSLAAFGRHCTVRAFQDRPPLTQCRNCWRFEHTTQNCKDQQRCRICSGPHDESSHPFVNPASCRTCSHANDMGDSMDTVDGYCPHDNRCVNCLGKNNVEHNHPADARRCPARLERYGTARENERRAQKSDNPWIRSKPKKTKNKPLTPPPPPTSSSAPLQSNRYDALAPTPTPQLHLSEANALINVGI
jgi:hypothetical protein